MDMSVLSNEIARKVVTDASFWSSIFGFIGVIVGAIITVAGQFCLHWLQSRRGERLDEKRKRLLEEMLRDSRFKERWRKLATMSRVIGADGEVTKRLLVELGARGSEREDDLWGLIEYHPLEKLDQ